MPRTKQSRKSKTTVETTEECESLVRDFNRLADQRIHKNEVDLRMQISSFHNSIDVALSRLPMEIRRMTLGELFAAEYVDENEMDDAESPMETQPPQSTISTVKGKKKTKRVTAASDDGYATECTAGTTRVSRMNTIKNTNGNPARNTRSSSGNRNSSRLPRTARSISRTRSTRLTTNNNEQQDRKDLLKVSQGPPKTASKFKTPSVKNSGTSFNVVTPKVKPNTPMNILRRPRDGEMVLSMQGSPLLVSSIVQERTANVNVPLHNGNVVSLLPNAGLRLSHMPELDPETMQQLKTLKGHIDMVLGTK